MTSKPNPTPFLLSILILACLAAVPQPVQASPATFSGAAVAGPAAASPFVKIMPFGDSITTSVGNIPDLFGAPVAAQASYRYWLYLDLINSSPLPFIFIGTQTDNFGGAPLHAGEFDQHNEGHSGYMAIDFYASPNGRNGTPLTTFLNENSAGTTIPNVPDIVLMHLGTNDLAYGYSVNEVITHLSTLIDIFRSKNPKVKILLAQIIPCKNTNYYPNPPSDMFAGCSKIPDLNAAIPALVTQKNTPVSPVILVDQYTNFSVNNDTYDGVHPDASGEQKMAHKWADAILSLYHWEFLAMVVK